MNSMGFVSGQFQVIVPLDPSWIDTEYQHVHHGRCFYLLEQGRLELLMALGLPNQTLLERGDALVITQVQAEYKREVKGDQVVVTCEDARLDSRRIVLRQRILNQRGKVAVEATIESQCMDLKTRRGKEIPADLSERFRQVWRERCSDLD